ncbi:glycoside hydrolase superfamily [Sporodiniella umbellata]|nr:glycoside hydrolase superfamily [Sporodiniella umbellata]
MNFFLPFLYFCCLILAIHGKVSKSEKVVIGYYPNFSKVDFSKYTHINYAFAIMTKGNTPVWTDPDNVNMELPKLVSAAHKSGAKVLTSIGGWTGSQTFRFKLDGIDIDWEYPGRQAAGCNQFDAKNDVKNFAILLKELRKAIKKEFKKESKEITIAAHVKPFESHMRDFAQVLDRVNIMTYDINGAWNPQTGANSPLVAPSGQFSFSSAIQSWISAGMPAKKLTGGIAFYGRSTTANENMLKTKSLYQAQKQGVSPKGDSQDAYFQDPYCSKDPGGLSGIWQYSHLKSEGVLQTALKAKKPWVRTWDKGTSTPWLFNPKTNIFISYEDPQSIAKKVCYSLEKGISGLMVWAINQDSDSHDLLKAVSKIKSKNKC